MNYWDKWTQPDSVAVRELEPGQEFYCPMDPQVVRSTYEPNGDVPKCPICGMPLSMRKKGEAAKLPAGITGRVQLSPERIQLAGIKTAPVEYRPMAQADQDGRATSRTTRAGCRGSSAGWTATWRSSTWTRPSPSSTRATRWPRSTARNCTARPGSLSWRPGAGGVGDLAAAARNKLLLLGVSQQEIDGIVASGQPSPRLVIRSPQDGYVVDKKIVVGAQRGSEDDAVRGGRPLDRLGRGRRLREGHSLSPGRPEDRSHGRGLSQSHLHREAGPDLSPTGHGHADQPRPVRTGQPAARTASRHVRHGADQHAAGEHRAVQERWRPRQAGDAFGDPLGPLGAGQMDAPAGRVSSSSRCRSGPSSIPARRRWCTSSGSRGCSKEWKSSLGLARTATIRSQGTQAGRQGGGRGRLPDRRRNAAQPGRRLDLLRRQRRAAGQRPSDAAVGPQCTTPDSAAGKRRRRSAIGGASEQPARSRLPRRTT